MPEAVIAMASVIPVYRSHRGSTPEAAAARPRMARTSILTPSSRFTAW